MLIGLAGLLKYGTRAHLKTTIPLLGYMILLIIFTQMQAKVDARVLWEPMLIIYCAILLSRQRAPDESIHTS